MLHYRGKIIPKIGRHSGFNTVASQQEEPTVAQTNGRSLGAFACSGCFCEFSPVHSLKTFTFRSFKDTKLHLGVSVRYVCLSSVPSSYV